MERKVNSPTSSFVHRFAIRNFSMHTRYYIVNEIMQISSIARDVPLTGVEYLNGEEDVTVHWENH